MPKIIKINVNKAAIMAEVALASSYAGAKSENSERSLYDRVATIKADEEILSRFWRETCGMVCEKFREWISSLSRSDEELEIALELSGSYEESLNGSVESDIFSGIAAGVIGRWFRYSYPERAKEWEDESGRLLESAEKKICYRKKPKR